jgi:protein gp37
MAEQTAIEWTDHTFNPWWGCQRVSPGCQHCYAEALARRWGLALWGPAHATPRRTFGDAYWAQPLRWEARAARAGVRRKVFCASMADVFEAIPDLAGERARLWRLIEQTPHLDWLLLTKRPENIATLVPAAWLDRPLPNVWYGTSVESQEYAAQRIPHLLAVPAVVRFLSCEPLLGPVDLTTIPMRLGHRHEPGCVNALTGEWWPAMGDAAAEATGRAIDHPSIGWVIAGGESGPGYREVRPEWARALRDQCRAAGVAFFWKQWSGRYHGARGRELDGQPWEQFPAPLAGPGATRAVE